MKKILSVLMFITFFFQSQAIHIFKVTSDEKFNFSNLPSNTNVKFLNGKGELLGRVATREQLEDLENSWALVGAILICCVEVHYDYSTKDGHSWGVKWKCCLALKERPDGSKEFYWIDGRDQEVPDYSVLKNSLLKGFNVDIDQIETVEFSYN